MLSAPQGALSMRNARIKIILAGEKFTNTISLQALKRVGPPLKNQGSSSLDSLQAVGYYGIMKLNKLIKKINKENAPPGGWKPEDDIKKAINWDKLKDPKVLKQLEKILKNV